MIRNTVDVLYDSTPVGSISPQWEFGEVWWLRLCETMISLLSCSLHGTEQQLLTLNLHSIQDGSNVEAFWSVSKILLHRDLSTLSAFRRKHEMKDTILRKIRTAFLRGKYSIEDKTKHRLRGYFTWLIKCLSKDHVLTVLPSGVFSLNVITWGSYVKFF